MGLDAAPVPPEESVSTRDKQTRFVAHGRSGGLAILDQCFFSGTNFLTAVIVGRFGGTKELGVYALAFSMVMLCLAFQRALFVSSYVVVCKRLPPEQVRGMRSMMLLGTSLLCLAVSFFWGVLFVGTYWQIAGLVAVAVPAAFARDFVRRLSIAERKLSFALKIDVVIAVIQLGALAWIAGTANERINAQNVLLWCAMVWVAVGFAALMLRRGWFTVDFSHATRHFETLWQVGRWVGLSQVVSTLQAFVLPWILVIVHSVELAGIYSACWTLVQVVSPAIEGVGNVLGPAFAESATKRDWKQLKSRVRWATGIFALLMIGLTSVTLVAGGFLLQFFYGAEYANHSEVLIILTLAAAVGNLEPVVKTRFN